jgi:hypothetical protein
MPVYNPPITSDEKVKYDSADPLAGYLSTKIIAGTGITLSEGAGADENKLKITSTVTASPAGSNTQIQFNDNSVFGASSNFKWSAGKLITAAADTLYLYAPASGSVVDGGPVWYSSADFEWRVYAGKTVDGVDVLSPDYLTLTYSHIGSYGGTILSITVVDGGTGYSEDEIVDIIDSSYYGYAGTGKVTSVDEYGTILTMDIESGGYYYEAGAVTFGGGNNDATGTITVDDPVGYSPVLSWDASVDADFYKVIIITDDYTGYSGSSFKVVGATTVDYTSPPAIDDNNNITIPYTPYSTTLVQDLYGSEKISGTLAVQRGIQTDESVVATRFRTNNSDPTSLGTALGTNTLATLANSFAGGNSAKATGVATVAIGVAPEATFEYCVAIGYAPKASGSADVAIGNQVVCAGGNSLAMGYMSKNYAQGGTAIGNRAMLGGSAILSMGRSAETSADTSIIIAAGIGGSEVYNFRPSSVLLGTSVPHLQLSASANYLMATKTVVADFTSLGSNILNKTTYTKWGTSGSWGTYGLDPGVGWTYDAATPPTIFEYRNKNLSGTPTLYQTSANMLTPIVVGKSYYVSWEIQTSGIDPLTGTAGITISCGGVDLAKYIFQTGMENYGVKYAVFTATSTANFTITPNTSLKLLTLKVASLTIKEITGGELSVLGLLTTTGGRVGKITTATDTYQVLVTDETVICNKATAFTVTLPTAVVGQRFNIKNIGAGTVTVDGASTDLIDDVLTQDIEQWECVTLQCYAANSWAIL